MKCTHGSTIGPVDEEQVFYLQSRGVGLKAARHLLTYAFAADSPAASRSSRFDDASKNTWPPSMACRRICGSPTWAQRRSSDESLIV